MGEVIAEERGTGLISMAPPPGSEDEQQLANEISELWAIHVQAKSVAKKTMAEIKGIRERLSERLYRMKKHLARPGRNGQWSAWLKERHISRATADRLVQRFAATLPGYKSPHESIPRTSKEDAVELATGVWPHFRNVLRTHEAVLGFIGCIAKLSGVPHEWRAEGLVILKAVAKAADELPDSAPASFPVSQVSDETPAATEEPKNETVVTPTEIGLPVAAADASNGVAA